MQKLKIFLQESRQELKRVNWPTKKETVKYTLFVIGLSLIVAAFLGLLDFIFARILSNIIS
ncbi:preprotein translocase subunit SecE [Candidatus Jorgensenbacteria bacterium CG_4_10_14_0_8_um_filter_39_13]|uniref:Protein translocase subunit SecE n=2 Tax=Candidatus Joergenseniibacteriota TaxID=1752739 RepID=A0A2M7RFZ0_9BACT|nr:MAG: preprotein translocase subunit SecE [Candidatus Jorgensenbacteria bacterium CG11_big_fil_rev_8_21_14_0_20_38_23]PIV13449.1 MAG: preprotein translocase subunit SecE [Candidatus Jorgensenbacteria bacterium CG03_land_8_20_14_0_80_38_39]PIW97446.1 MAG: preprotein translocase subunit SecE [Candidatus Jorgensenbacteria bacterium CG_4_8_14_3_um_filter_38_10]PIY95614.1 MAG: preprotein translocase subunit SecE [Candidatus Jorgensenbacteria bacterium CG_4_10_14_0_8_um_filter_39_13]PJA95272.1 MAG: